MAAARFANSPYAGTTVAIGTLHGKESAFAPAFRRWLDAEVRPTVDLDTDALGTFTRDVPRALSPADAATAKATAAAAELGTGLGLATEASYSMTFGGFGPVAHEELAVFVDLERGIRVPHPLPSYARVAPAQVVADAAEARRYLARIRFPLQGVVVRAQGQIHKGLQQEADVLAFLRHGSIGLEPDLRAHMNPDRRRTLRHLGWVMAARLRTPCPVCDCPGFGPVDVVRGLRCAGCGSRTSRVRADVDGCAACPERRERPRAVTSADPASCEVCNP